MVKESTFDTEEVQLNYAEGGTPGKPVMVLLHGLTWRWQAYTDDFIEYAQDWHLFAPDLRGHGKSNNPQTGYRLLDYAGDIVTFLREVVREPVVLVGHSLGALVALTVTHLGPAHIQALIANDPPLLGDDLTVADYPDAQEWFSWVYETVKEQPSFEGVLARCQTQAPDAPESELLDMAKSVSGVAPGTVRAALEDTSKQDYDLEGGMSTIRCPTLLLYGDFDQGSVVRGKDAAQFQRHVPQAVVHKIENGTHMLWWEQAEKRRRYVQEFLDTLD